MPSLNIGITPSIGPYLRGRGNRRPSSEPKHRGEFWSQTTLADGHRHKWRISTMLSSLLKKPNSSVSRSTPPAGKNLLEVLRNTGGWAVHTGRPFPTFDALFTETQAFFGKTIEEKKRCFDNQVREAGHASIDRYRERLFLRGQASDPSLRGPVSEFAAWAHSIALDALEDLAVSLDMSPNALRDMAEPWPPSDGHLSENIVRIFRYTPANTFESNTRHILTDEHRDLGLVAVGLRSHPGLEVQNPWARGWSNVEEEVAQPEPLIMVGRSLALLTRGILPSCTHRVTGAGEERFSWVFHLRLKQDAIIDTRALSSPSLEPVFEELEGLSGNTLTRRLWQSVTNVNDKTPSGRCPTRPYDQQLFMAAEARRSS